MLIINKFHFSKTNFLLKCFYHFKCVRLVTLFVGAIFVVNLESSLSDIQKLYDIPLADEQKIVIDSKILSIDGATLAFNPSIIDLEDKYLVSFRQDIKNRPNELREDIKIGCALFSHDFIQLEPTIFWDLEDIGAHDARLFSFNKKIFTMYIYLLATRRISPSFWKEHKGHQRTALVVLNSKFHPKNNIHLCYGNQKKEKNWTPFEYIEKKGTHHLHFVYKFNPLEIIELNALNEVKLISKDLYSEQLNNLWENKWGDVRGGTPALKINDEYLAFFHSCIKNNNQMIYFMGAITFTAHPPFKVTKISKYPILFKGIYSAKDPKSIALKLFKDNVIFPCGFVAANYKGKEVFHVICGENDHAIRIVTIDKNELLNNMTFL